MINSLGFAVTLANYKNRQFFGLDDKYRIKFHNTNEKPRPQKEARTKILRTMN